LNSNNSGSSKKVFICVKDDIVPKYSLTHDSHELLIRDLGLRDEDLLNRKFVRVQIWPRGCWFDPMLRFNGWGVSVDEENSLPAWFEEDRELWFDRCMDALDKYIIPHVAKGIYPGDLSINENVTSDNLKEVRGSLYVNGNAVLTASNLNKIGGKLNVSSNAKKI